jgi:hypothetical protein
VAERPHPSELRQPSLDGPVVVCRCKHIVRVIAEDSARIAPHVLDVVLGEPPLYLGERVAVLFRMLILIAKPRLAASRLAAALSQHGIERDETESRQPRRDAT